MDEWTPFPIPIAAGNGANTKRTTDDEHVSYAKKVPLVTGYPTFRSRIFYGDDYLSLVT